MGDDGQGFSAGWPLLPEFTSLPGSELWVLVRLCPGWFMGWVRILPGGVLFSLDPGTSCFQKTKYVAEVDLRRQP